jgi:hypothetical protein
VLEKHDEHLEWPRRQGDEAPVPPDTTSNGINNERTKGITTLRRSGRLEFHVCFLSATGPQFSLLFRPFIVPGIDGTSGGYL